MRYPGVERCVESWSSAPEARASPTVSARLGERIGLPVIHLDAWYWQPGWVEPPKAEWEQTVRRLLTGEAWVMDGNYGGTLDLRLAVADTVVFLDLPRWHCLGRVLRRRVRFHGRSRPDMAPGCPERLTGSFIRWIWNYPRDRRPSLLAKLNALEEEKRVVVLRSPGEVRRFLEHLTSPLAPTDAFLDQRTLRR